MTTNEAIGYANRKAMGETSPAEDILLKEWIENASREEYLQFSDACIVFQEQLEEDDPGYQEAASGIIRKLDDYMRKAQKPLYVRLLSSLPGQVAAFLLILLTGGVCWFLLRPRTPGSLVETPPVRTYIKPSLTLASGAVVTLDSPLISVPLPIDYTEEIRLEEANQNNPYVKILPGIEEGIRYQYQTIKAPAFRQYKIALPDGTLVWLNAGSRMQYQAPFGKRDRKIELAGEAYFEVAPDAGLPFIVKAGRAEITALGTRFNIYAYEDENDIAVTLLAGAVTVSDQNNRRRLSPGEQALLYSDNLTVRYPDTTHILNWKAGYFDFRRSSLQAMMRQISRWYNVKVVYAPGIAPGAYTGTLSRNIPLPDMVTFLSHAGIRLQLAGDTLMIQSTITD